VAPALISTCRLSMLMASARDLTPSQRSSKIEVETAAEMWRWLSISPGNTRLP